MPYSPDPSLVQAIRRHGGGLAPLLLATALVESGGRLDAVGDQGRSHGPFQEYDLGRGAGIPIAARRDPVASTQRAAREFRTFYGRGYRGPELAYAAQRPADRSGYIAKIAAALPIAQRILGSSPADPGADTATPSGGLPTVPQMQMVAGQLDARRLLGMLRAQGRRVLEGQMPSPNYQRELVKLARGALPRAMAVRGAQAVGQAAQSVGQAAAPVAFRPFTMGGGPSAHASRALGNWQSDAAYDLMGRAGDPVPANVAGVVTRISGRPGGAPGFAGYGITIRTPQGDLFYKHLGTRNVEVGQRVTPQTILGTLDAATAGGPHLHLGGTSRSLLDRLARLYVRPR